jgi:hypothetical protein
MKLARIMGIAVQAFVLGVLLYLAILKLLPQTGKARLFFYQGF